MGTRHIRFARRMAGGVAAGLLCAAAASAGTVTVEGDIRQVHFDLEMPGVQCVGRFGLVGPVGA